MKSCRWTSCALLFLTLATCASETTKAIAAEPTSAPSTAVEVKIDNFTFSPAVVTVKAGTQITWTNADDIPHTVVSDDHTTFKSKVLDTEEKFTFIASKPGTYTYFCSIHPHMTGKVIVQ